MIIFAVTFLICFFCGSIPTAYLVAKKAAGIDIRKHGSGNVGATNAFRVLGKKWGAFVFSLDFLKGYAPTLLLTRFLFNSRPEVAVWLGLGALLGHIFTPFLRFKGGKGVATGAGILAASYPLFFIEAFAVWLCIFIASKIVALASIIALLALVLIGFYYQAPYSSQLFFVLACITVSWTHRSNLKRLMKGEEKPLVNKDKI